MNDENRRLRSQSRFRACSRLRKGGDGGGLRFQALAYEAFDLCPQAGIALALHVAGREGTLEPGASHALHRRLLIVKTEVPEDLRLRIVGGGDACAAMDQPMRLIEVRRGGDIFRD